MLDGGMVEFESQSLHVSLSSKFKCNSSLMASGWRENGFRPCIIHLTTELSLLPPSPPIKKKKELGNHGPSAEVPQFKNKKDDNNRKK